FQILYENINDFSSDIVVCDYVEVYQDEEKYKNAIYPNYNSYTIRHYDNIESLHQLYTDNNITFVVPWNKLYKRHLFKDIRYKHGNIYDDETVAHRLFYDSEKITYLEVPLYYYLQRKDSQMGSSFNIKRFGAVYALKEREVFFRKKKEFSLHQKALKHFMDKFFWYYFRAKTNLDDADQELKKIKRTFDKSLIHLLKHNGIGWKQNVMCVVFSISPSLFQWIKDSKVKKNKQQQPSE